MLCKEHLLTSTWLIMTPFHFSEEKILAHVYREFLSLLTGVIELASKRGWSSNNKHGGMNHDHR